MPGLFFGVVSALSSVGLLATSAWLITRAAEHPPILFLGAAIVGVRQSWGCVRSRFCGPPPAMWSASPAMMPRSGSSQP